MLETEITVQVFNSFEDTDRILKNLGFKITKNFVIKDWYFTYGHYVELTGFESLIKQSFLVREIISKDKTESYLIYKNKKFDDDGNVLAEEKLQSQLLDAESAVKIFKSSGLNCWQTIEDYSTVYDNNEISFVLQNVKELGLFIEYEAPKSMGNLSCKEKFDKMKTTVKTFGLNLGKDFSCKKAFMKFNGAGNFYNDVLW